LNWHFVYVDCFSSYGKYAGEKEDTYKNTSTVTEIEGSPFIGIRALYRLAEHALQRMGVKIKVNAILIEREKRIYSVLLDNLQQAGYAARLKNTKDFPTLNPGEIAVVNDDCTLLSNDLLTYTGGNNTWAFYLIDSPYAASETGLSSRSIAYAD